MNMTKSDESFLTAQPWMRRDDESAKAFAGFQTYRGMEPEVRSVTGAYRLHRDNPKAMQAPDYFYGWGRKYAWKERAGAYDAYRDWLDLRAADEERGKARRNRRIALGNALQKLNQCIGNIDPSDASVREVMPALTGVVKELRAEYDDEPTVRQQVTTYDGGNGGFGVLAQRAADLTDEELAAQYRQLNRDPGAAND